MANRLFFDFKEGERLAPRVRRTFAIGQHARWDQCPYPELEGVVGTVKGIPRDEARDEAGTVAVYFEKTLTGSQGGIVPGVLLHIPAEELSAQGAPLDAPRDNANGQLSTESPEEQ